MPFRSNPSRHLRTARGTVAAVRWRLVLSGPSLGVTLVALAAACGSPDAPPRTEAPVTGDEASWETPFEASGGTETATYEQGIAYYRRLSEAYADVLELRTFGDTDSGDPLHLAILSTGDSFDPEELHRQGKAILLVNNAIHPGEPDGVDASMMLLRNLVQDLDAYGPLLDNVVVAFIPFYNVGGVRNRGSWSRVNQNGPREYGFRGNARNYDLNRDFIKADTRNARTFTEIFHTLDPDVLVDTHVSDGADYQHVMTLDTPQKDKLGGVLAGYLDDEMLPALYDYMDSAGFPTIPYVNLFGRPPDAGWDQFLDLPRYSSGYAALFQTLGFMTETHMLKPFDQRVRATYAFLEGMIRLLARDAPRIRALRRQAREAVRTREVFPLTWAVDHSVADTIDFRGYQATTVTSEVTGLPRLRYDRERPWEGKVPFYDTYVATAEAPRPAGYVIPQGWHAVADRLRANRVDMRRLPADTTMDVEVYRIEDVSSRVPPWEGHAFHDSVTVRKERTTMAFRAGDWVVPVDQPANRYIVETLEPEGADSFFRWNFFDTVLQQKEGYSAYVFEDLAAQLLEEDDVLREAFHARRDRDPAFAADARAQLDWIYERSPWREPEFMRYPVARVLGSVPEG